MQYSGENRNVSSNKEFKSNNAKNLIFNEKENLTLRTDRPPSSDFKNFKNLKAPQKMFGNKNTFLTNNYLRNDLHEEDFDYLKRIRNYNI